MRSALTVIPWLGPGVLATFVASLILATRVARALRTRRWVAILLVIGFGLILSATVTPLRDALENGVTTVGRGCDFERLTPPGLGQLLRINDTSLNVALFVPLGAAIGLLPASPYRLDVVAAAVLLPFAIEATQLVLPILGRGCQSADVVDNLTGLAAGFVVSVLASRLWSAVGSRSPSPKP
jgi:hypothetical protein